MKLSTPSHASPSTSSTPSFNPTMCNSKSTTSSGCFRTMLRKILCSGDLPKDPSQLDSTNSIVNGKDQNFNAVHNNAEVETTTTITPGIVARLMGLDSIVEVPPTRSLSRSRSMNSLDYFGECNRIQNSHKRVNSTLSFRENSNFLLHENDNFLVLNLENGRKRETELNQRVKKTEEGEKKEKKREKEKVLNEKGKMSKRVAFGNEGKLREITNTLKGSSERKRFGSEAKKLSQPLNRREVVVGEKMKRKKKKTNFRTEKVETESKSEDSSPVSVLDFDREASGTDELSSRRKLSPELENGQHIIQRSDGNLLIDERKIKEVQNNKYEGPKKKEQWQEHIEIWGKVCKVIEDEIGGSNQTQAWMNKKSELGDISEYLESEIFDHLLDELVDQLIC